MLMTCGFNKALWCLSTTRQATRHFKTVLPPSHSTSGKCHTSVTSLFGKKRILLFLIQQVSRECPWKNVFFRTCNISKRKQTTGQKHVEHCLTHLNKTACNIWSIFDKVHFWAKNLTPFFHWTLQFHCTFLKHRKSKVTWKVSLG